MKEKCFKINVFFTEENKIEEILANYLIYLNNDKKLNIVYKNLNL